MTTEQMELIDAEITASNARKLVRALLRGHIFRNSTPSNNTQRRGHINLIIAYQQRVDVATEVKAKRFYTFYDVQAEGRSILNTMKHLYKG